MCGLKFADAVVRACCLLALTLIAELLLIPGRYTQVSGLCSMPEQPTAQVVAIASIVLASPPVTLVIASSARWRRKIPAAIFFAAISVGFWSWFLWPPSC